jgi:hypothetical protein
MIFDFIMKYDTYAEKYHIIKVQCTVGKRTDRKSIERIRKSRNKATHYSKGVKASKRRQDSLFNKFSIICNTS